MEEEYVDFVMQCLTKIVGKMSYLSTDFEKVECHAKSAAEGIGWGNIVSKRIFESVASSIIKSIIKQTEFELIPDFLEPKTKEIYLSCFEYADEKFLDLRISYLDGISRSAITKHIDKEMDVGLIGLMRAHNKEKVNILEIQLPFMTEKDKENLVTSFMFNIGKSAGNLHKKIDVELKSFEEEIQNNISGIIESELELFVSNSESKYRLVS